jgi:gamma-glutamyl:cysteine ligase YbdK (ATP-grasp superfamily)
VSRAVYEQNRWAAARYGPRAKLIHPEDRRAASVPELYTELVELIGHDPKLDPVRCEGDRQLEFERAEDAAADVAERSVA